MQHAPNVWHGQHVCNRKLPEVMSGQCRSGGGYGQYGQHGQCGQTWVMAQKTVVCIWCPAPMTVPAGPVRMLCCRFSPCMRSQYSACAHSRPSACTIARLTSARIAHGTCQEGGRQKHNSLSDRPITLVKSRQIHDTPAASTAHMPVSRQPLSADEGCHDAGES